MGENRYLDKVSRYITEAGLSSVKNAFLPENSVLVSCIGSDMGKVAINQHEGVTNQQINSIISNKNKVDTKYLYYALLPRKKELQILASGGSVQPILNKGHFSQLEVTLPPIKDQKIIAHILGSLDDKIELNRQMNETLEEIAKTIFKSWFVDFDPVRAKMEGRPTGLSPEISALFPDELVNSEIGEIPKGWEVTQLKNQLEFVLGGDWGKGEHSAETPNACRCIRGADIANLQAFDTSDMPIRFLKESSFLKRALREWDIVFEISGGSPTQSTGRTVLITGEMLKVFDLPLTTSNFCRLLRFFSEHNSIYHYMMFRDSYEKDLYFQFETGTTGIKNFGFKYFSEDISYVLPSNFVLQKYSEIIKPIIEKSGLGMNENQTLAQLRDTLLPRLISGRLRIPDADKFLKEAGL